MYKENHYAFELHLLVWYKFLLKFLFYPLCDQPEFISRFTLKNDTVFLYTNRLSTAWDYQIYKNHQLRNTFYWHAFLWYTVIFVSKMLVHIPSKKFQCHLILKMILHDITLSDMVSLYLEIVYYTLFYPN